MNLDALLILGLAGALLMVVVALVLVATRHRRQRVKAPRSSRTPDTQPLPLPPRAAPPGPRQPELPTAGPRPLLVGLSGDFAGTELELDDQALAIGRDPRLCQLVFPPDNELICKRHCTLRWDGAAQQLLLEDCWSTNGTFVGAGQAVPSGQPRPLAAGERFYLGDPSVMFEVRFE